MSWHACRVGPVSKGRPLRLHLCSLQEGLKTVSLGWGEAPWVRWTSGSACGGFQSLRVGILRAE